jgi:hypothetical protein
MLDDLLGVLPEKPKHAFGTEPGRPGLRCQPLIVVMQVANIRELGDRATIWRLNRPRVGTTHVQRRVGTPSVAKGCRKSVCSGTSGNNIDLRGFPGVENLADKHAGFRSQPPGRHDRSTHPLAVLANRMPSAWIEALMAPVFEWRVHAMTSMTPLSRRARTWFAARVLVAQAGMPTPAYTAPRSAMAAAFTYRTSAGGRRGRDRSGRRAADGPGYPGLGAIACGYCRPWLDPACAACRPAGCAGY